MTSLICIQFFFFHLKGATNIFENMTKCKWTNIFPCFVLLMFTEAANVSGGHNTTPNWHKKLAAKKLMHLGQKDAFKYTTETTANNQLACPFCFCMRGKQLSIPADANSLSLSFTNRKSLDCGYTGRQLGQQALDDGLILADGQLGV